MNTKVPVVGYVDDIVQPGRLGRRANISQHPGPEHAVTAEIIEAVPSTCTRKQFWQLPDDALRRREVCNVGLTVYQDATRARLGYLKKKTATKTKYQVSCHYI
jgi:hypothetical protein